MRRRVIARLSLAAARRPAARFVSSARPAAARVSRAPALAIGVAAVGAAAASWQWRRASADDVDYDAVRADIVASLDDEKYDDGSYGPVYVRLAWHASGTYSKHDGSGGSEGAKMRFAPEADHGANAGLHVARQRLEAIKQKHPNISYADLWTLAASVAIEEMGGPHIEWRPGRSDHKDNTHCTPDGRLPDAAQGEDHVRDIFYRMGFDDAEIVALVGAHALGRCHPNRSGFDGPWTFSPTTFSNSFYTTLLENEWVVDNKRNPQQFTDKATGQLMMLPADLAFIKDPAFRKHVEAFAADEDLFFEKFASAWTKLIELGVPAFNKPWYQFW